MGFRVSLKSNRHTLSIWAETVNTVSLLVTVCDFVITSYISFVSVQARKLIIPLFLLSPKSLSTFRGPRNFYFFAVLPKCSSCPGVSPQRCFARSVHTRGLGKIISHSAGHSVVTDFLATKKAGTSTHTDRYKRIDLSLAVLVSHQCNRLWNQRRDCLFAFRLPTVPKRWRKRRYFRLVYRRPYPTFSRPIKLWFLIFSCTSLRDYFIILYRTYVCQYFEEIFM